MKKILSILVLSVLVVSLVAPLAALAQGKATEKLRECCIIRRAFEIEKSSVSVGAVPGAVVACTKATVAPFDLPAACKLAKGDSIGPNGLTTATATICPTLTLETAIVSNHSANWGIICLLNVVYYVTDWIFYLMMIAVVIVFVIAGAKYMMSSGDPEKTKSAKNLMIFGIVGLIVALIAKLVPSVVRMIVAM
ncbi:MAG: pilin [Patescibacteria group bacterium]